MSIATKTTWLTDYLDVWASGAGTVATALPAARAAKTFKALESAFGRDEVLARWRMAWQETSENEKRFLTPETFARRFGEFAPAAVDAFGFRVFAPEQQDLASKVVAALDGDTAMFAAVCEQVDMPRSFPLGVVMLQAYELLRGYHEKAVALRAVDSSPVYRERMNRLISTLS